VIVLDASALVELLLNTATGRTIAARIADPALSLHVPHLGLLSQDQQLVRQLLQLRPRAKSMPEVRQSKRIGKFSRSGSIEARAGSTLGN